MPMAWLHGYSGAQMKPSNRHPLLSVVIPTHQRTDLLPRAIESALHSSPDGDVEVVVVPNGCDASWKSVAEQRDSDYRISWSPLKEGNASRARNHGASLAKGKFIRFLDDDDYLLPAAERQLVALHEANADISSAPMCNVSSKGIPGSTIEIPDSTDYLTAALLAVRVSLSQGSIFSRRLIEQARWREDVILYDDYLWMLEHAKSTDPAWMKYHEPVCAYVHHFNTRLSFTQRTPANSRHMVDAVLGLHARLVIGKRLTEERSHAIAVALLTHAHSAFPASPRYLASAISTALEICAHAEPAQLLFENHEALAKHVLFAEWTMLAPRLLSRSLRRLGWRLRGLLLQR